jgi:hypothetical protein
MLNQIGSVIKPEEETLQDDSLESALSAEVRKVQFEIWGAVVYDSNGPK